MTLYYGIMIFYIPLLLVIAAVVLYFRFGIYGLIPVCILVFNIPIQLAIGLHQKKYLNLKNEFSDQRIKLISETVDGVRLVKLQGWEKAFEQLIDDVRDRELKSIRAIQLFRASDRACSLSFVLIAAFVLILIMFSVEPDQLNSSKIYATLEQLYELRSALFLTGSGFSFIFQISLILRRFADLLSLQKPITKLELNAKYDETLVEKQKELKMKAALLAEQKGLNSSKNKKSIYNPKFMLHAAGQKTLDITNLKYTQKQVSIQQPFNGRNMVEFDDFSSFWDCEGYPTLKNITLEIQQGKQYSIVGKISSGKTTFLHTLLEGIPHFTGEFRKKGSFSFVEQEPHVFAGKLKENILFGKPYEQEFYFKVLKSCVLLDDLAKLPNGDETEIGENGVNLSGGQKARISLARAVYSRNDTYLLDDPLSAVDAKVARRIYQECLNGLLKGKTVILVTHQIHFTKHSEEIFILDEGRVSHRGKYEELQEVLQELGNQQTFGETKQRPSVVLSRQDTGNNEDQQKIAIQQGTLFTEEKDEKLNFSLKATYLSYLSFSKSKLALGVVICLYAGSEALYTGFYYIFGSYDTSEDRWELFGQVGILLGCFMLVCFAKYLGTIFITTDINSSMHRKMVHAMIHSPNLYFDQTPSGRILTKFTNDLGSADLMLPLALFDNLEGPMQFMNICITVGIINPLFFLLAGLLVLCFVSFLLAFQSLIVQSKQLDMIYKAHVFSFFQKTIQGAIHVRIYEQIGNFTKQMFAKANDSLRTNITLWFFNRTFSFNQQVMTLFFSTGGIILALFTSEDEHQLGQTIVYLSMLVDVVYSLSRSIPNLQSQMTCIERILQICNLPSEGAFILPSDQRLGNMSTVLLSENSRISSQRGKKRNISQTNKTPTQQVQCWIKNGSINFIDVKMKYRNDLDLVLKGTSFSIQERERVGCVGRTGAGKSSIIQALFRMTELERGSSITIDGVDIKTIGLHTLRSSISIIPQNSFMFSGSIRRNLDLLEEYSDIEIWKSLEKTHLDEFIRKLPARLHTDMSNSENIFSAGQKQLICLARAILKNSKILILDEATANLDLRTDEFIQTIIKEQFTESTIFTIAHRLNTIADYDKVIVMDKGIVVEYDSPFRLLVKNIGDTTITSGSIFAMMVKNTGKDNAHNIFEIASRQYSLNNKPQQQWQWRTVKQTNVFTSTI